MIYLFRSRQLIDLPITKEELDKRIAEFPTLHDSTADVDFRNSRFIAKIDAAGDYTFARVKLDDGPVIVGDVVSIRVGKMEVDFHRPDATNTTHFILLFLLVLGIIALIYQGKERGAILMSTSSLAIYFVEFLLFVVNVKKLKSWIVNDFLKAW